MQVLIPSPPQSVSDLNRILSSKKQLSEAQVRAAHIEVELKDKTSELPPIKIKQIKNIKPVKATHQKRKKRTRKPFPKSAVKDLFIQLNPQYTSYAPKDKIKLFAKFKFGEKPSPHIRVRFIPKTLGKFKRSNKVLVKQQLQLIGTIKLGSKETKGKVKVCVGKECKLKSIVIIDKDIDKNMEFSTDGINFDELE